MLNKIFVLFIYILVSVRISDGFEPPFTKIINDAKQLATLTANDRILIMANYKLTLTVVTEIFNNYTDVHQIETAEYLYLYTCNKWGRHISVFDKLTLKPQIPANISVNDTKNKFYDDNLQVCLRQYCNSPNRGNYRLDCSHKNIQILQVMDNETLCYKDVYDVNLQNNNITVIVLQSFMKTFIYVVRLDLRNNPIISFNHKSFRPMKSLHYLYVPFVKNIINETVINNLMAFNTYLMLVECYTGTEVVFYAWSGYCKNNTAEFFSVFPDGMIPMSFYTVATKSIDIAPLILTTDPISEEVLITKTATSATITNTEPEVTETTILTNTTSLPTDSNTVTVLYVTGSIAVLFLIVIIIKICQKR